MNEGTQIFLSYGRGDDETFVAKVHEYLMANGIRAWYDRVDLPAVTQFTDEIARAIENSAYLVLFIGDHALNSEWCEREWRHALNHCIPIIPVLIKGTWGAIGERLPKRIRNINGVDATTLPIEKVISEILRLTSIQPDPLCAVQFAKPLPAHYISRDAYLDEMKQVIGIGDRTAKHVTKTAGYVGVGGIGKTTLANALAQDCESRRTFDYIFWLTLGENTTANDANRLLYQIGETFGDAREDYQDLEKARAILGYHLRDKHTLIVLDDAWKHTHDLIRAFQFAGMDCRLLITTRSHSLLTDLGARAVSVDKLTSDEGGRLMHALKPYADEAEKAVYAEIVGFLDGHALAVELASKQLHFYPPDRLLARLKKNALEANPFSDLMLDDDDRNASLERSLQLSYGDLGGDDPAKKADLQRRFRGLGIFAPNSTYPPDALMAMWEDADEEDAEDQAVELVKIGLLGRFGMRFGHHSLLMAYAHALLRRADEKEALFPKYADWYIGRAEAIFVDLQDKPELWGDQEGGENVDDITNIKALGEALASQTHGGTQGDLRRALDFAVATTKYVNRRMEAKAWAWLEMGLSAVRGLRQAAADDKTLMEREALLLNELGLVYRALGEMQVALGYYEQALPMHRQVGDRRGEATTLNNIGVVYQVIGEMHKALDYYEQTFAIFYEMGDRAGEATTLNNIGMVYQALGKMLKALDYYEQTLPVHRAMGDKGGEARMLNNIGGVYDDLGEKQKALNYYEQALPIYRAVRDRRGEATTLNNIGGVYQETGDIYKALDYFQQALTIHREVGNRQVEATTLNNIGIVYRATGDMHKALSYFEQALLICHAVGDRHGEATTLTTIGTVYRATGDMQKALDYYQQALLIRRAVGDRAGEATTLNNIGVVYQARGDMHKALSYFEQALLIRRAVGDRAGEATTLNNMGGIYDDLGDKQKALDYFLQALTIHREVGNRQVEATIFNNMGGIYDDLGDKQKALDYYEQAIAIFMAVGALPYVVAQQVNIASLLDAMGRLDEAITYAQQAVTLMHEKGLSHDGSGTPIARIMQFLTDLKRKRGDADVSAEPTDEEKTQALIAQLVAIYKAQGEAGLRAVLKQNDWSDEEIDNAVQIVKQQLGM